jgi:hypothetical protein
MNRPLYIKANPLLLRNQVSSNIEGWVKDLKAIGIHGIWMPAWESGKAYFPTNIIPVEAEFPFQELRAVLHNNGMLFYTTCQIFHDPISFETQVNLRPVNAAGDQFRPDSWYYPICPSSPEYKARTLALLRSIIDICLPDGITIDFIRYPFFWEKIYSRGLYMEVSEDYSRSHYCFCSRCIRQFFSGLNMEVPENPEVVIINELQSKWLEWRYQIITDIISEFARIASEINRPLVCHIVAPPPEYPDTAVLTGITGQNYRRIAGEKVILSPMLYEGILGRKNPGWLDKVIGEMLNIPDILLLPAVDFEESRASETARAIKMISTDGPERILGAVIFGRDALSPPKLAKILSI